MTGMNRISTLSLSSNTLRDMTGIQQQLADLQEQISSGVKAKTFQQLNGQVEQYTLLENRIRRSDQFVSQNEVATARLQTTDQALSSLGSIADSMQTLLIAGRSTPTGGALSFVQQMQDYLKSFGDSLNMQFDGRYLFGGTATLTPPVPSVTDTPLYEGVPDASYYAGAQTSQEVRIDENISFKFPVRADDPAFQKIYAAAHQAITAYQNGDDAGMGAALGLMQSGQTDLNSARSSVNTAIINVGDVNDRLNSMSLYWKGLTEKVGKTDIVAATTQVSNYEAVLQATFQVYARLSQLRLSDYLK